jgi:integrase
MAKELAKKMTFTAARVKGFKCPADKPQAFLWDATTAGLGLRMTPAGKPSYVFQGRYQEKSIRQTIGGLDVWTIPQAQEKARELQRQIDEGRDPRQVKAEITASDVAKREADKRETATVGEAWQAYLKERRPHWGVRHYFDHEKMSQTGGAERKRAKGVLTTPGLLAPLLILRLSDLNSDVVQAWAEKETKLRPTRTRLALRLLKAFLRWCADENAYKSLTDATAASGKKTREAAGKNKPKANDYLQREQLPTWFSHVRQIPNPVISAYLQCLLLTGARREELAELKWDDVNFQWNGMTLKDKIKETRPVPLTPYVAHLLSNMPRRNEWVFSSPTSATGRLTEPSIAHRQACAAAGLQLTLHGLRRSFASLCEWLDIPGGISAQIQGHAPQGVREQNYINRPLDLLRVHHEKIEAWILEQAGVTFVADKTGGKLRAVVS